MVKTCNFFYLKLCLHSYKMHYNFYKNLLEKNKLNDKQYFYLFWNPAIYKNIKLLGLEEIYNNMTYKGYPNTYEPIEDIIYSLSNNPDKKYNALKGCYNICLTYDFYSLKKLIKYNPDIIEWKALSLNNHITIQDVIDNPNYKWSLSDLCHPRRV